MNIHPVRNRKRRSEVSGSDIFKQHQDELKNSFEEMFKDIERLKELDEEFRKVTCCSVLK